MEMRKLSSTDLFAVLNIMAKIGIKDLIKEVYKQRVEYAKKANKLKEQGDQEQAKNEAEVNMAGAEVMAQITELVLLNLGRAQNEINALIANLCSVTKKEIERLPMDEYVGLIMSFLSQPEFRASLNVIMSSLK
jgi:hypothetical protein